MHALSGGRSTFAERHKTQEAGRRKETAAPEWRLQWIINALFLIWMERW